GHFGRVYLATLMHGNQSAEIVAVKTMKYKAEECEMVELFLKEAVLMKDFQHPHVLGIKGITFADDSTPMVILPFMANGDLRNYILNPELNITILNLLMMGMQVAHGMAYLSSHHFVHRDLAARNCMVNNSGVVKIADFGMSRQLISCEYYRVKHGKDPFPVRWMAPECLEAKIFTTKSDVWAYGVLLWELMTRGAVPYAEVENWQVAGLIQSGELLKQPPFCPDVVYAIMMKCWTQDAQERPTFDQIISDVNSVVS
ncbi:hypothetical protein HELRODRAFT_133479, partial [Helobdella robusta]|uniref:Protein kinase domain-containing protein n=1 Tax=Helobdella robusta TaxID=6412 RepID=T1EI11_HELRO